MPRIKINYTSTFTLMACLASTCTTVAAFVPRYDRFFQRKPLAHSLTRRSNWVGELWEEVIEFSTYGPSERRMRKAQREQDELTTESFRRAGPNTKTLHSSPSSDGIDSDYDALSMEAFRTAVANTKRDPEEEPDLDFDGYALRDFLVGRWGAPLDIDFQRSYNNGCVYCTVLPVAFGNRKCRHETELDYLMHLQGIIEILHKYRNLGLFLAYCETTTKTPKPGTDSVPFRLELSKDELAIILGKY